MLAMIQTGPVGKHCPEFRSPGLVAKDRPEDILETAFLGLEPAQHNSSSIGQAQGQVRSNGWCSLLRAGWKSKSPLQTTLEDAGCIWVLHHLSWYVQTDVKQKP
jgi:hypothetical protein